MLAQLDHANQGGYQHAGQLIGWTQFDAGALDGFKHASIVALLQGFDDLIACCRSGARGDGWQRARQAQVVLWGGPAGVFGEDRQAIDDDVTDRLSRLHQRGHSLEVVDFNCRERAVAVVLTLGRRPSIAFLPHADHAGGQAADLGGVMNAELGEAVHSSAPGSDRGIGAESGITEIYG